MKINFSYSAFTNKGKAFFFSTLLLSLFTFSRCTHKIATDTLPKTQIIFGHGGGFVGVERQHALLPDGQIIRLQKDSAMQEVVRHIGKKKAAKYYAQVDSMRLNTWLYNSPGNIYHYIILKNDGKRDNKIVWDGSGKNPNAPTLAEDFYQKLRAELPKKQPKKKEAGQEHD